MSVSFTTKKQQDQFRLNFVLAFHTQCCTMNLSLVLYWSNIMPTLPEAHIKFYRFSQDQLTVQDPVQT